MSQGGRYCLERLGSRDKLYAEAVTHGLRWKVLSWEVREMYPRVPDLIRSATNIGSTLSRKESERQTLHRLHSMSAMPMPMASVKGVKKQRIRPGQRAGAGYALLFNQWLDERRAEEALEEAQQRTQEHEEQQQQLQQASMRADDEETELDVVAEAPASSSASAAVSSSSTGNIAATGNSSDNTDPNQQGLEPKSSRSRWPAGVLKPGKSSYVVE